MTELTEHTFIKQTVKTFWAVICSVVCTTFLAAALYFGIKDAIKDIKNEMVLEFRDIRFQRMVDSLERSNDWKAQLNTDIKQDDRLRDIETHIGIKLK